jgi:hypothetical protein
MIRVLKMFLPLLALILFASGCASTGQVKTTKQALPMSCEKFITFAMAENGSLVPKPPNVSDKWWKKMQNKYRNVCFEGMGSPTSTSVHYLVVLSESDSAFNGLYPVFRTETDTSITPISGSGTITDYTGSRVLQLSRNTDNNYNHHNSDRCSLYGYHVWSLCKCLQHRWQTRC